MESLLEYNENLKNLWNNLNKKAKIIIGVSVAIIFLLMIFLIIWGRSVNYEVLFSNLTSEDAEAIVDELEQRGVSYKLEDRGNTIKVPASQVHRVRLSMAGEGLPSQGMVGFEIFDQSQFGTTDFEREVNYYRALSGELSRSIQSMSPIEFAKVQITAPKDSLFIDEEEPAKASVLIDLKHGVSLDDKQVKAICNLVGSSVQKLNPEQITIVDSQGNHLSASLFEEDTGLTSAGDRYEIERNFERQLKTDIENLLNKVVGRGNFSVQVQAELNFDSREMESKTYLPVIDDEGIVRSQEIIDESYISSDGEIGGVPGTFSNIPQYQEQEEDSIFSEYEKTDTITNYELNEKIERAVYSPGDLMNLSVSVIVNDGFEENFLLELEDSIKAAIGYSEDRNDTVNITSLPFDRSVEREIQEARAAAAARETQKRNLYGTLLGLILIILFISLLVMKRRREKAVETGKKVDIQPGEEEIEQAYSEAASELSEEEKRRKHLREEIEDVVHEQPENVAEILKSWLIED